MFLFAPPSIPATEVFSIMLVATATPMAAPDCDRATPPAPVSISWSVVVLMLIPPEAVTLVWVATAGSSTISARVRARVKFMATEPPSAKLLPLEPPTATATIFWLEEAPRVTDPPFTARLASAITALTAFTSVDWLSSRLPPM